MAFNLTVLKGKEFSLKIKYGIGQPEKEKLSSSKCQERRTSCANPAIEVEAEADQVEVDQVEADQVEVDQVVVSQVDQVKVPIRGQLPGRRGRGPGRKKLTEIS